MSAIHDKTVQVVEVGALVELDDNVLSHGIAFVSEKYPPLLMRFHVNEQGDVTGYEVAPIQPATPEIERVNFVKVGHVLRNHNKPRIIGLSDKMPKIILPGDGQ